MDLFVVNRFTGDDTGDTKTEEKDQLSQVLNKIKKRKKRKIKTPTKPDDLLELDPELFKSTDIKTHVAPENTLETTVTETDVNDKLDIDEPESKIAKTDPTNIEGFTILNTNKFDSRPKVQRVLPKWLRNPTVISTDLQKLSEKVSRAELNKNLKERLKENKIKYLFPVQAGFIPWQLRQSKQASVIHPPDVCVSAPTGSGKSLAFAIPVLQHLLDKLEGRNMTMKAVRALIVLPTQSLAQQIYDLIKSYSAGTAITVGIATSSDITFKNEQKRMVANNSVWGCTSRTDILICTAGRLVEHIKVTKGLDLQYLEYVIMDEADRMVDNVQDDWLRHLGMHLRSEGENPMGNSVLTIASIKTRAIPQKLLFSATLSSDPEKLEKLSLFQPKLFTCVLNNETIDEHSERIIGKYTTPNELVEKYITCTPQDKPLVLYKLIMETIQSTESSKIIVFTNEKTTQHRLAVLMDLMAKKDFIVKEISNETPRKMSKEILELFANGKKNVLISTNFLARGIDFPNVDCVISYNAPTHMKTYVHRVGRTARGGVEGTCITMLEPHEERKFLGMLQSARSTSNPEKIYYDRDEFECLNSLYKQSLESMKIKINSSKRHALVTTLKKKRVFHPTGKE